jgi:histidinol-phosphate aminotransferase
VGDRSRPPRLPTGLVRALPATVPFVAPEALERRRGRRLKVRVGANENAFGLSPVAMAAMRASLEQAAWYCDPESHDLRHELAREHGTTPDHVVVGSGIDDLLGLVVRTFLDRGEVAVTSLGAYPTFNYHVAGHGGTLHTVPYRDDRRNDLEALLDASRRLDARLLYLANPDNPTGTWRRAEDVLELLDHLPDRCLLVLDEAYLDFALPGTTPIVEAEDPRLIRLRTFSKAHGMAGLRIGYGLAASATVAAFDKVRLHFGVNRVAQIGALASLGDRAFLEGVVAEVAQGRREYEELARGLDLATLPSATNFVAVDLGVAELSRTVVESLLEMDVFVRRPTAPGLDRYVRVTVGTRQERGDFAEALTRVAARLDRAWLRHTGRPASPAAG